MSQRSATGLIILKAQIDAYRTAFLASSVVVFIGATVCVMIPKVKLDPKVKVHVE